MPDTLVLGAGGLLGRAFVAALGPERVRTAGRATLQGANLDGIRRLLCDGPVKLVINCAADTDVDGAERNNSRALAANAHLPGLLAHACREAGALLVHFSSTGCYGDWKARPYRETDPMRPTTAHHASKVAGEQMVSNSGCESLIVRTGWLFGGSPSTPRNFVWNRLVEASATDRMAADGAQRGCPTAADDVVRQVLTATREGVRGTVNIASHGAASRYEYVARIVRAAGLACDVIRGPAFQRAAPVSSNEAAVNARLGELELDEMPRWEDAVDRYVGQLTRTPAWADLMRARL